MGPQAQPGMSTEHKPWASSVAPKQTNKIHSVSASSTRQEKHTCRCSQENRNGGGGWWWQTIWIEVLTAHTKKVLETLRCVFRGTELHSEKWELIFCSVPTASMYTFRRDLCSRAHMGYCPSVAERGISPSEDGTLSLWHHFKPVTSSLSRALPLDQSSLTWASDSLRFQKLHPLSASLPWSLRTTSHRLPGAFNSLLVQLMDNPRADKRAKRLAGKWLFSLALLPCHFLLIPTRPSSPPTPGKLPLQSPTSS